MSELGLLEGNPGVPGLPPGGAGGTAPSRVSGSAGAGGTAPSRVSESAGAGGTAPSNGFESVARDGGAPARRMPVVVDSSLRDPNVVREGNGIALPAPAGRSLRGVVDSISRPGGERAVLRGRIDAEPFGHFVISIAPDGRQVASIHLEQENTEYFVRYDPASDQHLLSVLDLASLPEEAPCEACTLAAAGDGTEFHAPHATWDYEGDTETSDPESSSLTQIDVMVVYTPAAANWANDNSDGIHELILDAMAKAQLAMDSSDGLVEFRLVHTAPVDYVESGDAVTDLERLTYTGDQWAGYLDEVHQWRDEHAADLVALFVEGVTYGGVAWIPPTAGGYEGFGFSISRAGQAASSYTHAHEMGHNLGLAHDIENAGGGPGVFDYSYGWRWEGTDGALFRSIMAYAPGTRVPNFSNPDVLVYGVPSGDALVADNARTIREMAPVIAAYRDTGEGLLTDQAALEALYHATGGESWEQNAGWLNPETPVSEWFGVTVSGGRVIELNLGGNNLTGSLPAELGDMARLERLRLYSNHLTGPIPPELGKMHSLWTLRLEDNQLSGALPPELGQMHSLLDLWLDENNFTGPLPSELGNIRLLQALFVNGNDLSGSLPQSLTQLELMNYFWFHDTDLCEPQDEAFQAWLGGLENLWSSGIACPEPASVALVIEPDGAASGELLATQPVVAILDSFGDPVAWDNTTDVSVAIFSGEGGVLSGTTTLTVQDGVAEFTDLVLSGLAGESYTLRFATSPDLGTVDSQAMQLAPGAVHTGDGGSSLAASPSALRADGVTSAQVRVQLRDRMGNEVPVAGTEVRFFTTLGHLTPDGVVATDEFGRATVELTSLEAGEAELTAEVKVDGTDDWSEISEGSPATVVFDLWEAVVLELSGSDSPLQAGEERVFQVSLKDFLGDPVISGVDSELMVEFRQASGEGSVGGLGTVAAVNGVATATLTGGTLTGQVLLEATATSASGAFLADDLLFDVVARTVAEGETVGVATLSYDDGEIAIAEGSVLVVERLEVAAGGTLVVTGEGTLRVGELVLGANAWLVSEGSIEVEDFLELAPESLLSLQDRLSIRAGATGGGSQVTVEAGSLEIVAGALLHLRHGSLSLGGDGLVSEIAGRLELFHCLGSIAFNGDVAISGTVLALISDFHLAPGTEVSVLTGGDLTFDGCLVDSPGDGFSLGVAAGGAFTLARSVFENGVIEIASDAVLIRDNLFFDARVEVASTGAGAAVYHNIADSLENFLHHDGVEVLTEVDGWGNVENRNATKNDLVLEMRADGLEPGRTLDPDGNLFIQPGDSIEMGIETLSLAAAIDGADLLLGYADEFFTDPVLVAGTGWQLDADGTSGESGLGRLFGSLSHAGTDADGVVARLGLTSTESEGRSLVFFRVRQPIDTTDGFSKTALRDAGTAGLITPFTMNTGYVTIDGTPPLIAEGGSVEQDQDGLREMTWPGEVVEQGALRVSFEAHDTLAGIDDSGVRVTLLGLDDLNGESVDGILVDSSETLPIGEEVYTRYVFEIPVTETTANGAYLVQAAVSDRSGNTTTSGLGEVTVNKNEIDVDIALQGFTAGSDESPLVVAVTFAFTDADGGLLEERIVPVILGSANLDTFTFRQVPEGTAYLSAKAPKHLRRRLPVGMDENGQGAAIFAGTNRLLGGDLTGNNRIRGPDLAILSEYWFQSVDTNPDAAQADITGDGRVRAGDLAILQTNWFLEGDPR